MHAIWVVRCYQQASRPTSAHANVTTMVGAVKSAFGEIGKGVHHVPGEVSIDGGRSGLQDILTVAALGWKVLCKGMARLYGTLMTSQPNAVVLTRNFDGTPTFAKMGNMSTVLIKHARYLHRIEPENPDSYARWTTITYEQCKTKFLNSSPEFGVLEMFAQRNVLSWTNSHGDTYTNGSVPTSNS